MSVVWLFIYCFVSKTPLVPRCPWHPLNFVGVLVKRWLCPFWVLYERSLLWVSPASEVTAPNRYLECHALECCLPVVAVFPKFKVCVYFRIPVCTAWNRSSLVGRKKWWDLLDQVMVLSRHFLHRKLLSQQTWRFLASCMKCTKIYPFEDLFRSVFTCEPKCSKNKYLLET